MALPLTTIIKLQSVFKYGYKIFCKDFRCPTLKFESNTDFQRCEALIRAAIQTENRFCFSDFAVKVSLFL